MPRYTKAVAKEKAKRLVKTLQKANGNRAKAGRMLGVSRQAIRDSIEKNPEVKPLLEKSIDKCLEQAGITTARVYGQLSAQLSASNKIGRKTIQNWKAQDSARKDALELMGHKKNKVELGMDNELSAAVKTLSTDDLRDLISLLSAPSK